MSKTHTLKAPHFAAPSEVEAGVPTLADALKMAAADFSREKLAARHELRRLAADPVARIEPDDLRELLSRAGVSLATFQEFAHAERGAAEILARGSAANLAAAEKRVEGIRAERRRRVMAHNRAVEPRGGESVEDARRLRGGSLYVGDLDQQLMVALGALEHARDAGKFAAEHRARHQRVYDEMGR